MMEKLHRERRLYLPGPLLPLREAKITCQGPPPPPPPRNPTGKKKKKKKKEQDPVKL